MKKIILFALVVALGISCKKRQEGGECSYNFVSITFLVKTTSGIDVPLLNITAKNQRTGREIELESNTFNGKTTYLLANDNDDAFYSKNGDKVTVSFTHNDKLYTFEYVVAFDGCHVLKRSGPDEIKVD
jgi:hypothetical protein